MKKQILLLSVALCALSASPTFATTVTLDPLDDITTTLTTAIQTATANPDGSNTPADIKLDEGGNITINLAGAGITLNSNNSVNVVTDATILNKDTANAIGILVDLTTHDLFTNNDVNSCGAIAPPCHTTTGIIMDGTIDMTGTGDNKTGIWLEGPTADSGLPANNFYGDIDEGVGVINIVGDNSVGVLIDALAIQNGNVTLGEIAMSPTSTSSDLGVVGFENNGVINGNLNIGFIDKVNNITDIGAIDVAGSGATGASGTIGLDLAGTINGNVTIDSGSSVNVTGTGAQGIVLTGNINAGGCDTEDPPVCSSLGSLINRGVIATAGTSNPNGFTGNPTAGAALEIGASVAGGIYNAGTTESDDSIGDASISSNSVVATVDFSPVSTGTTDPLPINIGVYTGDSDDPGFSFYNRGSISNSQVNADQGDSAFAATGSTAADTTFQGGIFNSNNISASAFTDTNGAGINATAMSFGTHTFVGATDTYTWSAGCDCLVYNTAGTKTGLDEAALVNLSIAGTSGALISASVSGASSFNTAVAINIGTGATLPSIINTGTILAASTSSDTTVTGLAATAIIDASGTLTYIGNLGGNIEAIVTTLDDDSQRGVAIDLSNDTTGEAAGLGVQIDDKATADHAAVILGDIKFGAGDHQIVNVLGFGTADTAHIFGDINYGPGGLVGSDKLNIGDFATVVGAITSDATVGVKVDVEDGGTLTITNDTTALNAAGFHIATGATLNLTVLEDFKTGIVNSVPIAGTVVPTIVLDTGANLNITYGSWIPNTSNFVLFTASTGNLSVADTTLYNTELNSAGKLPFLFASANLNTVDNHNGTDSYVLTVVTKNASDLGLTGYAAQMLPFAAQALSFDDKLGAALINGVLDQKTAQTAFGQFAPDVTGGARALAMSLTDQGTGPVAARQRMLRMYGKDSGEVTLWGQEFAEFIKDPGNTGTGQTGYKDHGFGFALGLDGGDPKIGWYGGALSFYSGDIVEALPRDSHANSLWYMLTGYTDWRGRGLFLDTKVDVAYMTLKQKRFISLSIPNVSGNGSSTFLDEADSNRPGLVGSAGFTTGVILAYGSTTLTPQFSMDAMTMREEGVTETHPTASPGNGAGFDLSTKSFYSNSLRVFLGADVREDLDVGDFFIQPDVRLGYRYDFLNDPAKVTAHFVSTPNTDFTIEGPDPSQGNFVAGASIAATTDAWSLGLNFDFVRGTNGATTEVGTIHLLGRI